MPRPADAILSRPMAAAALLFIAGILLHPLAPPHPALYLLLAALLLPLAFLPRPAPLANGALSTALLLTALAAAQLEAFFFPPTHIARYLADEPRVARLELRIDSSPTLLADQGAQAAHATVLRILTASGWQPATGQILLKLADPHPNLASAQRVSVLGQLHRPLPATHPGQFDASAHYREQRLLARLHVLRHPDLTVLDEGAIGWLEACRGGVRGKLEGGFRVGKGKDHALLRALVLGDRDPQLRDIQEAFRRTGTSHHLAISGMHVAIVGGMVYILLRLLRTPPRLATWLGLSAVILYGSVALPSPPVVRSILLAAAVALGLLARRHLDGIQLLSASVLLMLAGKPLDLYNAGFQLSFGTVLGLMLFTRPALDYLKTFEDPHLAVARQLKSPTRLATLRRWLTAAIVAGIVAWLTSAPLIAWHFSQLNPWAILASLLLALPVLLALVGGIAKILLTIVFPSLAPLFAELASWPVVAMRQSVEWLGQLPGSDLPMLQPAIGWLVLYYLLLLLPLVTQRLRWAGPSAALLLLLGLLFARPTPSAHLRLTLLDVGAGQCAILQTTSGQTVMIDAGTSSRIDLARDCINPFLKHAGIRRIDHLLVSHADADHCSAVPELEQQWPIASRHAPVRIDNQTSIEVLWPPQDANLAGNDASLVLRIRYGHQSLLFPGDIQNRAISRLLQTPADLRADLLVAPHHGSLEPATAAFVKAVGAKLVIASSGRTLSQKQQAMDRLLAGQILRTGQCGAIEVTMDGKEKLTATGFRNRTR